MKIIPNQEMLQKYFKKYNIERFFPPSYCKFLILGEFQRGEVICQQGQKLGGLYFFAEGKIKIVHTLANGKENILDIREKACIIGEIEFMVDQPVVSSVVALKKTRVVYLPTEGRREELLQDAKFLYNVSRWLAEELYQLDISSTVNVIYSVKERLALHIMAKQRDGRFSLELGTLADSMGTSYRHLLRVINQFIEEEVIKREKNYYQVLDFRKLNNYISE